MKDTGNIASEKYRFLAGGGEMGALTREKDWSETQLGDPAGWPQSLKTTLGIILNSKFPMFLWWGPELICFYNDAYRPSLGQNGKHPSILGMSAREAWAEIWDIIKPLIDQVLTGGEATWSEDQLIPIYRNGKIEDVYWTFSYSPVHAESGEVAGVLVTCNETTDKVLTQKQIKERERSLRLIILQAPVAIAIFRGPQYTVEIANTLALTLWGRTKQEVLNKPILDVMAELESQGIRALLDHVYQTGEPFAATELPVQILRNGRLQTAWVNFVYEPLFDSDGVIDGIVTIGVDVTVQTLARKKIEESEQRLNIVIKAGEIGTWELDLATDEMILSERYLEIFGYDKNSDVKHERFIDQIYPDDRPARDTALKEAMKTGVLSYQVRVIWKNQSIHWIDVKGKTFCDEAGNPVKLIGTIRDITEEKHFQQELAEREEKFRLLADSMPQFVWTSDANGELSYFNHSVLEYSGLSVQEVNENGLLQIIHPDDRMENIRLWRQALSTGSDFLFENRFRRFDGEYRWQLSRAIPQRDSAGNIQMWVGTSTDIQQIKKQEQQKDYFISMASHELKTPVTSIKGYVQLLKRRYANDDDAFLGKSLGIIDKQIVTLTNLISELLDLSKIKSGRLYINQERFSINSLIQETVDELLYVHPDYNIQFKKGEEAIVNADRERIGQVLINLLTNAIKYSPNSSMVTVLSGVEDSQVTVSVEDSGIGISKNDQERIFERFFRVEGKNEKTFPGFGIGLFIASEIIQRHNGAIGVKSETGKGSVFYFSLSVEGGGEWQSNLNY